MVARHADGATATGMATIMRSMALVTACNLLGLPAAVEPVGVADGLPQAVQLIATRPREDRCLAAAEIVERGTPRIVPIDSRTAATDAPAAARAQRG